MAREAFVALLCCCALFSGRCRAAPPSGDRPSDERESVISWASEHAIELDSFVPGSSESDLSGLNDVVGDARVVLLGDSRHDAREQWLLKHRIICYLVREMGFSVLALEESLPCTAPLNAYLLGERDDLEAAQSQLGAWYLWDTEELSALLRELRTFNESAECDRPVRLYGFDISDGVTRAVDSALALLSQSGDGTAASLRKRIDLRPFSETAWFESMGNFGRLSQEETNSLGEGLAELVAALEDRRSVLVERAGEMEYEWALRQAIAAGRAHAMLATVSTGSYEEGGEVRERSMAENIEWLLRVVAPGERVIVWAHNFHVSRSPLDIEIPDRPATEGMRPLGSLLGESLGDTMLSIGFSFEEGSTDANLQAAPEGWFDELLARVGPDVFLLDLRSAPRSGPVDDWLSRKQSMRGQGGRSDVVPRESYDVVAFVRRLGSVTPTSSALERFGSLGW